MGLRLHLTTQTVENYDLESGSDSSYWKFKGGDDYFVTNIDEALEVVPVSRIAAWAIAQVTVGGEGYGYVEYVTEQPKLVGEDFKSYWEELYESNGDVYPVKNLVFPLEDYLKEEEE